MKFTAEFISFGVEVNGARRRTISNVIIKMIVVARLPVCRKDWTGE